MRERYRESLRFEMDPKNIRKLAQTPGERRICTEVYKEIVAGRLKGIGQIRVYLLDALAQNPDAGIGSFEDSITSIAERHDMPLDAVLGAFRSFFKQYRLRRDLMSRKSDGDIRRDAAGQNVTIEEIFRDTFSIFIVGPRMPDDGSRKRSRGGSYWPYYENGIYTHSSSSPRSAASEKTRIHEEEHAIYELEHYQESSSFDDKSLKASLRSARDEMLAYLREGEGAFSCAVFLLPGYKPYFSEHNPYEYMHKDLSEEDKAKYLSCLKESDAAAKALLNSKLLGIEEIIGVLSRTPLEKWRETADRIIGAKDSVEKFGRFTEKLKRFVAAVGKLRPHK